MGLSAVGNLRQGPESEESQGRGNRDPQVNRGEKISLLWQFQARPGRVGQDGAALTIEAHIMVRKDGWAVPFGGASDHHMKKAIRRLNVVFLEGTDGTAHSGLGE